MNRISIQTLAWAAFVAAFVVGFIALGWLRP